MAACRGSSVVQALELNIYINIINAAIMMTMSRFVERCRSAEQVGFQMSSERQCGERVAVAGQLVNCFR